MRPLELVVNGFRSYAEETRFDWRGRRLVGIVGPIGSGKSSLLDAIAFALYGRTPSTADTHTLINQRQTVAQVSLTFRVDDEAWRVVRAIKAKGQSQHALYPFDEATGKVGQGSAISGQQAVTARITQLLGLDFSAFSRSILLAQNRFAEFLNATQTDRDKVLKGVFNLDRIDAMHQVALERRRDAERDAVSLAQRLAEVETARAHVVEWRREQREQTSRRRALEALRPAIEACLRAEHDAAEAQAQAQQRGAALDELSQTLPAAEASAQTLEAVERTARALATQQEQRARAEAAAQRARVEHQQAEQAAGGRDRIEAAQQALQARTHARDRHAHEVERRTQTSAALAAAETAIAGTATAVREAQATAARARTALQAATKAVERTDAALHAAERRDLAATLRGGIAVGDPCPICGRKIARLPAEEASPDLDRAEQQRNAARDALEAARTAAHRADLDATRATAAAEAAAAALDTARTTAAAAQHDLEIAERALATAEAKVRELLGDGDAAARLEASRAHLATAERAERDAAEAERTARAAETTAAAAAEAAQRALTSLRLRLASAAAHLDVASEDSDDPVAVRALLAAVRARWSAERLATRAALAAATTAIRAATEQRQATLVEAGVPAGQPYEEALSQVRERLAALDAVIAEAEQRIAAAAGAEAEGRAIAERREIYARLTDDLTPSKFLHYLLEDERMVLAGIGSERFEHLSGGRYRFTDEGGFAIVDLAAAETPRSAGTLSGGETFLASLSLALALAEMVTRGGGRLDAFFLDEGFGSLDEQHLDLAMEGIERLATESDERLVVVVSHVAAMRERIEDLIELDRDPATGNTIVRRGATVSVAQPERIAPQAPA